MTTMMLTEQTTVTDVRSCRAADLNTDAFASAVGTSRGAQRPEDDLPEHELLRVQATALKDSPVPAYSHTGRSAFHVTVVLTTKTYATSCKDVAGMYEITGELGFDQQRGVWTATTNNGYWGSKHRTVQASGPRLQPVLDELNDVMVRLIANKGSKPMRKYGDDEKSSYTSVTAADVADALDYALSF